jgi:hypothetical protein
MKISFSLVFALTAAVLACGLLSACKNSVLFTTSTMLGVELNALEGGEQSVKVGYQRAEGVMMPVRKKDGKIMEEAYPVISLYDMDTGSLLLRALTTTRVKQVFATGRAAVKPTAAGAALKAFQALEGELLPKDLIDPAARLIKIINETNDSGKLNAMLAIVNDELKDYGDTPTTKGKAKLLINDAVLEPGGKKAIDAALTRIEALDGN